jgi:hypothetical protein
MISLKLLSEEHRHTLFRKIATDGYHSYNTPVKSGIPMGKTVRKLIID